VADYNHYVATLFKADKSVISDNEKCDYSYCKLVKNTFVTFIGKLNYIFIYFTLKFYGNLQCAFKVNSNYK
jgi:hypothetical protein